MSAQPDVPCPIDYAQLDAARSWAAQASLQRPWREDMFQALAAEVARVAAGRAVRVLELGSGPGLLALALRSAAPQIDYVGLDVSPAMHQLSRERHQDLGPALVLLERSFKSPHWPEGLGRFDLVVTNQAVHELRHRRHALGLHRQVAGVLHEAGVYLVSDHFLGEGAMTNAELYMTPDEQQQCLQAAGFAEVTRMVLVGDLVLHRATGAARQTWRP